MNPDRIIYFYTRQVLLINLHMFCIGNFLAVMTLNGYILFRNNSKLGFNTFVVCNTFRIHTFSNSFNTIRNNNHFFLNNFIIFYNIQFSFRSNQSNFINIIIFKKTSDNFIMALSPNFSLSKLEPNVI